MIIEGASVDDRMAAETATADAAAKAELVSPKSLLEDDEDDEHDDEDALSRNPSIMLDDDDNREHPTEDVNSSFLHWDNDDDDAGRMDQCHPAVPMCQGDMLLPGCHAQALVEQMEFVTRCQNPLDLFALFQEDPVGEASDLLPGMYSIPVSCEYCGAANTDDCPADCDRPKLFFRNKRPPFCPPNRDKWEPLTDYRIETADDSSSNEDDVGKQDKGRRQSFLGGLFQKANYTTPLS